MKLNRLIGFSIAVLFNSSLFAANQFSDGIELPPGFLANLPPGETVESVPGQILEDPPIYLDVDDKGRAYGQYLERDKAGNLSSKTERVYPKRLRELRDQGRNVVLQNMSEISLPGEFSGDLAAAASTSFCPLPSSFSILGSSDNMPTGFAKVANTNRPAGVTTQWIVFDFWTSNYRNRGSHMPIHLFHDEIVHGWGSFIGDNHESPKKCNSTAFFNSQIQGWVQLPPQPPPGVLRNDWQSVTYNGSSSCGNEMFDGVVMIIPELNVFVPKYRLEMQASTGHWVAYRIFEYKHPPGTVLVLPENWEVLTDWRVLDVDADLSAWSEGSPPWLSGTEGILIQATKTSSGSPNWSINISNTQCGWF